MSEQKTIKKHLASGELSQTGLEFRCQICQQNLGQQPLQHIKGTPHKNKVFTLVMQNPSRYPSLYSGFPKALTQAHKKGIIRISGTNLECVVCTKSLSGESPTLEHLNSDKHQKLAANFTASSPVPLPAKCFDNALPPTVQMSLRDGTVQVLEDQGIKKFWCKICDSSMTGDVPLQQHLNGSQHQKNVKDAAISAIQQPRLVSSDNLERKQFRVDTRATQRQRDAYRFTTSPKGLVIIFNYTFKNTANPRTGSEFDEINLKSVFQQMDYKVVIHRDCPKSETLRHFQSAIQSAYAYSAFVAFFLSHGNSPDRFQCSDNLEITVDNLYMLLIDSKAKGLRKKPKILLFNYCRGNTEQENLRFDSGFATCSEAPRDLALVQATLPQFKARRHVDHGTLFVESLCEILETRARDLELTKIINLTSKLMQQKGGTTATVTPIDFEEFFFI